MYSRFAPSKAEAEYNFGPSDRENQYYNKLRQVSRWIDNTNREEPIHPYIPAFDEDAPWETYYRYLPQRKQWEEAQLSDWINEILQYPPANPFTPSTPRSVTPSSEEYEYVATSHRAVDRPLLQKQPYPRSYYGYSSSQEDTRALGYARPSTRHYRRPRSVETSQWTERSNSDAENEELSTNFQFGNIPRPRISDNPAPAVHVDSPLAETSMPSNSADQNLQRREEVEVYREMSHSLTVPASSHTHLLPVPVEEQPTSHTAQPTSLSPPQASLRASLLSSPQSNTHTSVYSYPSSRTESTEYGMFYTRMAISQDSMDTAT